MNEVKLSVNDYTEVMACIDLIKQYSENPGFLCSRSNLAEVKRYANFAEIHLKRVIV